MNKKVAIVGIASIVLLGGAVTVACPYVQGKQLWGKAAAELPEARKKAKALGIPLEPSDMKRNPPVEPKDNAASLLRAVTDALRQDPALKKAEKASTDAVSNLLKPGLGVKPADELLKAMGPLEAVLATAHKAAECSDCDFEYDWAKGADMVFPELAGMKSLVKLLNYRAEAYAATGRLDLALADLRASRRIGSFVGKEPTLINMLVEIACDAISMRGYEFMLTICAKDPKSLAKIGAELDGLSPLPDLLHSLKGEIMFEGARQCRTEADMKSLTGQDAILPDQEKKETKLSVGKPTEMSQAFEARVLQFWTNFMEKNGADSDSRKVSQRLDELARAEEATKEPTRMLMAIIAPVFGQAGLAVTKMDANRRCTRALVAVLQFKAKHGAFPTTLGEAGVKDTDPFDGAPLRYLVADGGCRIYSVGQDLEDNGGIRLKKEGTDKIDVVVQYPFNLKRAGER